MAIGVGVADKLFLSRSSLRAFGVADDGDDADDTDEGSEGRGVMRMS